MKDIHFALFSCISGSFTTISCDWYLLSKCKKLTWSDFFFLVTYRMTSDMVHEVPGGLHSCHYLPRVVSSEGPLKIYILSFQPSLHFYLPSSYFPSHLYSHSFSSLYSYLILLSSPIITPLFSHLSQPLISPFLYFYFSSFLPLTLPSYSILPALLVPFNSSSYPLPTRLCSLSLTSPPLASHVR